MEAKYILQALDALREADAVLMNFKATAEEKGRASAHCTSAAISLRIYSGIDSMEVTIEKEAA